MNALAVVFRLLSLFSLVGLVAFVWLQWETEKAQKNAFLDEQVSNGYSILQSTKEAQWKDISEKNSKFKEVFLDNQPVGLNDENPLENALTELKTSENAIMRGKDYRDKLDDLAMEFGAGTFFWNSEKKSWEPNPAVKPEGIAALKDPFSEESKFPKEDVTINYDTWSAQTPTASGQYVQHKNKIYLARRITSKEPGAAGSEDDWHLIPVLPPGAVIPAVPRENRLRTVMGMLYKDRNDLYGDIASLRSNIVERDQQLRESQNLFNDMKTQKEEWEAKSNDFELKLQNTEADLAEEKKLRQDENEAAEQQIMVLNNNIAGLEQQKIDADMKHTTEIDSLKEEHGNKISQLQREIQLADDAGYRRGIDEMLAKQQGGAEALDPNEPKKINPFDEQPAGPPQLPDTITEDTTELTMMTEYGIPSSIARIDSRSGMLMLPIGSERGMNQGEIFTLWKGKKEAARIKVQSTEKGYSLAYILPRFGEPNRLRPGDVIQIVPEKKNTL